MFIHRHRKLVVGSIRLTAIAAALMMLTVLTVTRSQAAFSDTTDNSGNSFASGSVVLTDDDTGTAMFTVSAMTPGVPAVQCLTVTYSGSLTPADIRMYGTSSGALAPYLDTTIEVGTGGSFGNCAGFVPSGGPIFNNTLANFSTTHTGWLNGLATFTAAANPTSRTLRFTVDVQNNPLAQTQTASADFTFEAQD